MNVLFFIRKHLIFTRIRYIMDGSETDKSNLNVKTWINLRIHIQGLILYLVVAIVYNTQVVIKMTHSAWCTLKLTIFHICRNESPV